MSSELDILEPILMADEIQGNVLGGFNKDHQAILPLRFGDTPTAVAAVRLWLASILPAITWLREVVDYKRMRRRRIAAESREPDMPALWRNIAFSYPGLRKLTEQADAFDPIFRDGLPAASFRLVSIPLGCFDGILLAKILCPRSLCDEYRPRESPP